MKGLARRELKSFQVDFMFAIEAQVRLGKILPDDADQFYRRKKKLAATPA